MGGFCSKSAKGDKVVPKKERRSDNHKSDGGKNHKKHTGDLTTVGEGLNKKKQEPPPPPSAGGAAAAETTGPGEVYDGIPRYAYDDSFPHKSRSVRSRQAAVAKVCFNGGFTIPFFVS